MVLLMSLYLRRLQRFHLYSPRHLSSLTDVAKMYIMFLNLIIVRSSFGFAGAPIAVSGEFRLSEIWIQTSTQHNLSVHEINTDDPL